MIIATMIATTTIVKHVGNLPAGLLDPEIAGINCTSCPAGPVDNN
jgi:hypothetical protein